MNPNNIIYFPELKVASQDFEVEYDFELFDVQQPSTNDSRLEEIEEKKKKVEIKIEDYNIRLNELNKEIDRLTNNSDGLDYMVAVGSGVIAGLIDSFWVGDFSLERGREWGSKKVEDFVLKVAKLNGYKGDDLQEAIEKLEEKFPLASDSNTRDFGGGLQHHLRDFAHHPTIVGLFFSLLTQFTAKSYGTDRDGNFLVVNVRNETYIGKNLPEKFLFGVVFWFFHMVSDMAGSNKYAGEGTGLPGPIVSLMKELSALPFFKNLKIGDMEFSKWISKLFNGTLLGERDENGRLVPFRFDLRTEIGVGYELGRQSIPIIINECLVRGFYFIRRFFTELKEKNIRSVKELKLIDLTKVLPFKNRTIVRMLTISTGTFTALDLGDAAIRSAIKSKGESALFLKEFILKVNFVGLGRFAIAIGTETYMGMKKQYVRSERMKLLSEQLHYLNANVYYTQAAMWVSAENTEKTINEALHQMEKTTLYYIDTLQKNKQSLQNIGAYREGIEQNNPGLIDEMIDVIRWGNISGK